MRLISRRLTYSLLLHYLISCATATTANPICIIGGGITGLTLANLLQDRLGPANVHLYEGESRFGGKIFTFRTTGSSPIKIEKGPVLFSALMTNTLRYVQKYNLTLTPFSLKSGGKVSMALFNPDTGSIIKGSGVNLDLFQDELLSVVEKYREAYNQATNNGSALDPGYLNLSQAQSRDLSKPIESWLRDREMAEMVPFFTVFLTTLGYGDVRDLPALYALKLVSGEEAYQYFMDWELTSTVEEGYNELIRRMSEPIENKFLGWRATEISRNFQENGTVSQTLVFTKDKKDEEVVVNCSRTVLAFPPLLRNLMGLITNLSQDEKRIFNQVKVLKYASSGVEIPAMDGALYCGMVPHLEMNEETGALIPSVEHPPGDGSVVLIGRAIQGDSNTNQSYFTAYSWIYGDYSDQADARDLELMERKLNDTLEKIDPSARTLFRAGTTQYFPHVMSKSIKDGFYKDFDALQGVGGLYYATTMLTFEIIDGAIELAEDFVQKYF